MDYNGRFGQIEALLADLLRRMDRQAEQIDAVINILKISDERQVRGEERQDAMLTEMRRESAESTRRFDEQNQGFGAQGQRLDAQSQLLKEQGQRTDALIDTQMQMLKLMSRQADRTDELAERVPTIAGYEGRVRRLEDAVFNKAS